MASATVTPPSTVALKPRPTASSSTVSLTPAKRGGRTLFWLAAVVVVVVAALAFSPLVTSFALLRSAAPVYGPPERVITLQELKKHIVKDSAWVVVDQQVWDVTNTIMKHPAGPRYIIERVGTDITEEFYKHHHREGLLGMLESQPNRIKRVGVLEKKKEEKHEGRKRWWRAQ